MRASEIWEPSGRYSKYQFARAIEVVLCALCTALCSLCPVVRCRGRGCDSHFTRFFGERTGRVRQAGKYRQETFVDVDVVLRVRESMRGKRKRGRRVFLLVRFVPGNARRTTHHARRTTHHAPRTAHHTRRSLSLSLSLECFLFQEASKRVLQNRSSLVGQGCLAKVV